MISIEVDIDDVMDQISDEDLIDEVRARDISQLGVEPEELDAKLSEIHYLRENGKDYQRELSEYIWQRIGKLGAH
jgi:hypothetical protein